MVITRKCLIFCISFMLSLIGMAQEKKAFTLDDLIPGGATNYRLYAEDLTGLRWNGEKIVWYDIEKEELTSYGGTDFSEQTTLSLEMVNKALENVGLNKVRSLYNTSFSGEDQLLITSPRFYAIYEEGEIVWKTTVEGNSFTNPDFFSAPGMLAYTVGNNLWIATEDKQVALTDEPEGVVCGQSVHRHEFGISKGTFWSPKGTFLAFYRMDERMVTDYPLVDISTRIATLNPVKYPMAGMQSHEVSIGIYKVTTGELIYLETGDPKDRYFTNLSWSPDEKFLYIIELNREQNRARLVKYNIESGKQVEVIREEINSKYVEPEHPILFINGNPDQFIYQSQKDGFNHLYLYDLINRKERQLTSGNWLVQKVVGFDEDGKNLFFLSTENSPLESHLYKLNIKTGKRVCLTKEAGVHEALLSASGKYVVDRYSSSKVPRRIDLLETENEKLIKTLLTAEDPYQEYAMPDIEIGTLKAADGVTDLYYRLLKPIDFDAEKKYPVIVYVYGGPHNQMIRNLPNWATRGWDIYMAQLGYVVFTLDNRGSMNRGFEFESATFHQLGMEEGKDQLKGVEFLKNLPYVDGERIGIHGWSFGGYMTIAQLLRYPELYKVGVAGGPVVDWKYYEIMYGERYMGTPENNPEGYEECNLNNLAGELKDHLLVIHDDMDDVCVLQHTLSFMKACVEAYTFPDLFIYPGHEHNVRGKDRVHLYNKITRYFQEKL